uniref:Immunoglobulin subtype domain-containing protein n=1 Tax=Stegastes partitus TaxID=144197 RepID=A0A3B5AA37_9TELE
MAVHLSALLILAGLTGISCITTITEVSVKAEDSVTIPCLYDRRYRNNVKALCVGYYWNYCKFVVTTDQPDRSGRFSISDEKTLNIFTVTMKHELKLTSSGWYWCAKGDFQMPVHVTVTEKPTTTPVKECDNYYSLYLFGLYDGCHFYMFII